MFLQKEMFFRLLQSLLKLANPESNSGKDSFLELFLYIQKS